MDKNENMFVASSFLKSAITFDSATGCTKFSVRSSDTTVCCLIQQNPRAGSLFDARSSNRYVYAKCDPVNVTDPGGAQATLQGEIYACIAGAIGDLLALFKPLLTAGIAAIIAGASLADIEVEAPTIAVIGATIIVGCLIGAAAYGLLANFPQS